MTHYTQVPNVFFDDLLMDLSGAELKLLLLVIRQTLGWVNRSGKRKIRDWLSGSQLQKRTGLSRRAISLATSSLVERGLLVVSDAYGGSLLDPEQRKGRIKLYYAVSLPVENLEQQQTACAKNTQNLRTFYPQQKQFLQKKRAFKGKLDLHRRTSKRPRYVGSIDGVIREGIHPELLKKVLDG